MLRFMILGLWLPLFALAAEANPHPATTTDMVRMPGHAPPRLEKALPMDSEGKGGEPLTLTLVLKRDDQAGFERYLRDVYDPKSKNYRKYFSQKHIAAKFGPSRKAYGMVLRYLRKNDFELVEGSTNRLTLTVRGTRADAEQAFDAPISDYNIGHQTYFSNGEAPRVPRMLASYIQSISGLSNRSRPSRIASRPPLPIASSTVGPNVHNTGLVCGVAGASLGPVSTTSLVEAIIQTVYSTVGQLERLALLRAGMNVLCAGMLGATFEAYTICGIWGLSTPTIWQTHPQCREFSNLVAQDTTHIRSINAKLIKYALSGVGIADALATSGINAQKIGLLEFDTYHRSDVADWLALFGGEASLSKVTDRPVNGGVTTPGPDQAEVLLDLDAVMLFASLPDISYAVYHAPRGTSFQTLFNAMINDGVTVISNSWSQCENETTLAEAQGIDAILQQAAALGISVLNASGDSGTTCLNGSLDTVGVPADSPSATAVGGTNPTPGPGLTYVSEAWWDGTNDSPPTGRGGFGVSKIFGRPSYQNGLTGSLMRSVPDVVTVADPAQGMQICQKSAGGCPSGHQYGGTSMAAPLWAANIAKLNRILGTNIGNLNARLYPLAGTDAFHTAASMNSDFQHVGLGSPDFSRLLLALSGQTVGPASNVTSHVAAAGSNPDISTPADGTSEAIAQVLLLDSKSLPVSGKSVTLTMNPGSHAILDQATKVSDKNGMVLFRMTDLEAEDVILTATDVTDNLILATQPTFRFSVPTATSAGINAFPATVNADGTSAAAITITLKDTLNRPAPGKTVTLSQGNGHSVITAPHPSVTDANGQIVFTATDLVNETVTYTAVDVTDGDLTVPGSGVVTFQNGSGGACGQNAAPPVGLNGYSVTPFASGFPVGPLFYSNVNYGDCSGVATPAFLGGKVYAPSFFNGDLYLLGGNGGAVSNANKLTTLGPTLAWPVTGKDGRLYATRAGTGGNFNTGVVLELDPGTGAVLRTLASNLTCPQSLVVDPLSGDLFFDDACFGAGSDNPSIFRLSNPASANPALGVYATLPSTPNGQMAFSPKGTLYVVSAYTQQSPPVYSVSGTDGPNPPTVTPLNGVTSNYWLNIGRVGPDGEAQSLITLANGHLQLTDMTANPASSTLLANGIGGGAIGPDGCLYMPHQSVIYKLTDPTGGCGFLPNSGAPSLGLTPATVSPNPEQGTAQSFTANLNHVATPEGTPVFFSVSGANQQIKLVRSDTNGQAVFTYAAAFSGRDKILATAEVNGKTLTSNPARVNWTSGKHTTFLSLNLSPGGGTQGQPVLLKASLTDISVRPPVALNGQTVDFTLGSSSCSAMSDAAGLASCTVTPTSSGVETLTAHFAGDTQFVASETSIGFNLLLPVVVSPASRLINISTRGQVGTGDNVMIGGFVIGGTAPHKVLIRAIGPSMAAAGVTGTLNNPRITLTTVTGQSVASNDDWQDDPNAAEIQALGRAPSNPNESTLLLTLDPNTPYTPIVEGVGGTTGVALVEVYDVDPANLASRLINISTRGRVGTGDNVMIGGFVIGGTAPHKVLIRAIGPSMAAAGVTGTLNNPRITLTTVTGQPVASNDDWQDGPNAAEIQALGRAPTNPNESALLLTLDPNTPYTPIVEGVGGTTGVALVEVYEVP